MKDEEIQEIISDRIKAYQKELKNSIDNLNLNNNMIEKGAFTPIKSLKLYDLNT